MMQYNNETVSVITPVYNVARFLSRTLDSILSQSYADLEIVLVDDCSEDNSEEIIIRYIEKYPNIIYHKQDKNMGAAVARNTALNLASGRFVAFLDSDDLWYENKLEKQLAYMKNKNAAISCTAMEKIDEEGRYLNAIYYVRETINYKYLLKNTIISTSTVIIDRNMIGNFQMPLRRGGQDYATWLMLMRNGTVCYGLNEILSCYRVMSKSLSSNKWKSIIQVWQIQTNEEKISKFSAAINVCFFIINAFIKHYIK